MIEDGEKSYFQTHVQIKEPVDLCIFCVTLHKYFNFPYQKVLFLVSTSSRKVILLPSASALLHYLNN